VARNQILPRGIVFQGVVHLFCWFDLGILCCTVNAILRMHVAAFSAVADYDDDATKAERSDAAMAPCSSNISSFECTLASSVDGGMNCQLLGR